jgi:2-keto-4-pentenoate hydratase/2-oxohepta-3-ene-1,7-dioic acid hydratase in catechol pathway
MKIRLAVIASALVLLASAAIADVRKFVRFETNGQAGYGELVEDTVHELTAPPYENLARTGRTFVLKGLKLLAPTQPGKVLAVALNFRSHAGNSGAAKPELFAKLPSALIGHGGAIVVPADAQNLHYEGELVIVIGKRARKITIDQAPGYIFGVSAGNDISERTWQFQDSQWLRAKASDGFAPAGPYLVSGLDYNDLLIETRLNGRVEQSESTRNLIHSVDKIVAYASRYFTLEPGDMIFSGTPGSTRRMKPGDRIEITVQGVGTLSNTIELE